MYNTYQLILLEYMVWYCHWVVFILTSGLNAYHSFSHFFKLLISQWLFITSIIIKLVINCSLKNICITIKLFTVAIMNDNWVGGSHLRICTSLKTPSYGDMMDDINIVYNISTVPRLLRLTMIWPLLCAWLVWLTTSWYGKPLAF